MNGDENLLSQIQSEEFKMLIELERICKEKNLKYYLAYGSVLGAIRHSGFIPWDTDIDIMVNIIDYKKICDILNDNLPHEYEVRSYWNTEDYESLLARLTVINKAHNQIHIDIFPVIGTSNNKYVRDLEKKISFLIFRLYFIKNVNVDFYYKNETSKKRVVKFFKALIKPLSKKFLISMFEKIAYKHKIDESQYVFNICGSYGKKEIIPKEFLGEPMRMMFEEEKLPIPSMWHEYLSHFYEDYMTPKKDNYV